MTQALIYLRMRYKYKTNATNDHHAYIYVT